MIDFVRGNALQLQHEIKASTTISFVGVIAVNFTNAEGLY